MLNRVAYIFLRESEAPDPVMVIALQDGTLRFYASPTGGYGDTAARLNSGAIALGPDDAEDMFDDVVDKYDGQTCMAQVTDLTGGEVRRLEMLRRRWSAKP